MFLTVGYQHPQYLEWSRCWCLLAASAMAQPSQACRTSRSSVDPIHRSRLTAASMDWIVNITVTIGIIIIVITVSRYVFDKNALRDYLHHPHVWFSSFSLFILRSEGHSSVRRPRNQIRRFLWNWILLPKLWCLWSNFCNMYLSLLKIWKSFEKIFKSSVYCSTSIIKLLHHSTQSIWGRHHSSRSLYVYGGDG